MKHVFISYSSKDRAYTEKIKSMIQADGMDTWIAPDNIPAGSTYTATIANAVKSAGAVVLILSSNSLNSAWVEKEIERAVHYRKQIFPVQIDAAVLTPSIELMISTAQIVQFQALCTSKSVSNQFMEAVKKAVYNIKDEPVSTPTPPKPKPASGPKTSPSQKPTPSSKPTPNPTQKPKKNTFYNVLRVFIVIIILYALIGNIAKCAGSKDTSASSTTQSAEAAGDNNNTYKTLSVNDYFIILPLSYSVAKNYFGIENYHKTGTDGDYYYFDYDTRDGFPMRLLLDSTPPKDQTDFQFNGIYVNSDKAKICGISPGMHLYEVRTELGYQYTEETLSNDQKYLSYTFKTISGYYRVLVFYDDTNTVNGIYAVQ